MGKLATAWMRLGLDFWPSHQSLGDISIDPTLLLDLEYEIAFTVLAFQSSFFIQSLYEKVSDIGLTWTPLLMGCTSSLVQ